MNWDTVLTSAGTAIAVTVAVEYFAKPRLEARKERILSAHRSRDELIAALVPIAQAAEMLLGETPKDVSREMRDRFRAERQRQYDRLQEQVQHLYDDVGRYSGTYVSTYMNLVMRFVMNAQGVMLSARTQHEKARLIKAMTVPMATVLSPSWRRLMAVARAKAEVVRAMDEIEGYVEEVPAPAIT